MRLISFFGSGVAAALIVLVAGCGGNEMVGPIVVPKGGAVAIMPRDIEDADAGFRVQMVTPGGTGGAVSLTDPADAEDLFDEGDMEGLEERSWWDKLTDFVLMRDSNSAGALRVVPSKKKPAESPGG
jgi:hypothetical protein